MRDLNQGQNWKNEKIFPAIAAIDSPVRLVRSANAASAATNSLSAIRGSIEQINAVRIRDALRNSASTGSLGRVGESLGAEPPSLANFHLQANPNFALPIHRAMSLPNLSPRELVQPRVEPRHSGDDDVRPTIRINSSPTVVIQAQTSSNVRNDVIEALRAHREELFDQLKRESVRRERAQF